MTRNSPCLEGLVFGRLTVLKRSHQNRKKNWLWLCRCVCGSEVIIIGSLLKSGNTSSCGCLRKEVTKIAASTHGMTGTRLHRIWKSMNSRCLNSKTISYRHYGGRGISICDQWRKFENFFADMGEPPSVRHTLDRINSNGNYEPSNCRWATPIEQANNTKRSRLVVAFGETMTVRDWSTRTGKSYALIMDRLQKGWTPERAISEPKRE